MWSGVPADHPRERGEKKSSPHFPSPLVGSPHRRGEKRKSLLALGFQAGSPLRVRGKILSYPGRNSAPRITPASAGKRQARSCGSREPRDHPRGYREKIRPQSISSRNTGSPPRVRGKEMDLHPAPMRPGITPAGAGKRPNPQKREKIMEDHPRGCGEKIHHDTCQQAPSGSPTRVRGKATETLDFRRARRITHAGAGKSLYPQQRLECL